MDFLIYYIACLVICNAHKRNKLFDAHFAQVFVTGWFSACAYNIFWAIMVPILCPLYLYLDIQDYYKKKKNV